MRRGRATGVAVLTAAAILAAAAGVAGCGSSSVSNVVDPVAKAATVSNQASGMRMSLAMHITTSALPAPISGSGSGVFDLVDRKGSFSLTVDLGSIPGVSAIIGMSSIRIDEIIDGSTIYIKLPHGLNHSAAMQGKPWAKIDLASAAKAIGIPGFSSLMSNPASSNPSQLLRYLNASGGKVTKVGSETVDGFQTTHYRARIQLDRVPNSFPAAQRAQVRQAIASLERVAHVGAIPVDVWIDGQHLVRRMDLSLGENVSGQAVNVGLRVDIPEYGPQPPPQLPPASQVADLTAAAGA